MDGRNVNRFIHKYVIAAAHAILWLAALSLAAYYPEWWILLLIILNAGWQKYMNGRIPPRLQETIFSDIRHRLCHHYEDSQKKKPLNKFTSCSD